MKPHGVRALLGRSLALIALMLATGLRFYRLDAQSFWNDEGNSARLAERPLHLIVEGAAGDIHPPGYYILLHGWRAVAGRSEFALRMPSALAGIVWVALTYRLGCRSFGRSVGAIACWLAALSPFAVYYSQEARMYALLTALGAASTLALVSLLPLDRNSQATEVGQLSARRMGLVWGYVLLCAAGLYTQYVFPFILLVHNALFAGAWLSVLRRSAARWRWVAAWAAAQGAIALLFLPWLPFALGSVTGWSAAGRSYGLAAGLLDVLRVLSVGPTCPPERALAGMACFGLFCALGLLPIGGARREGFGALTHALYLLLPVSLVFALDLYKPAWLKFLLIVLPACHVLVARGVVRAARWTRRVARGLPRIVGFAGSLALTALSVPSLWHLYFDPAYARDDYRRIAADIATYAPPDACVVLDAPNQWEVFTYYYPAGNVLPAPYLPTSAEVMQFLDQALGRCGRLYTLYWGENEADPERQVETALAQRAYPADARWYGNVRLVVYGVGALPEEPLRAAEATFGGDIRLRGVAVEDHSTPGGILPVTLFWQALAPVRERYKVTVQLWDAEGRLVAQHDGEPGGGLAPTTAWRVGQQVIDRHGVPVPANLAGGEYALIVGLYHAIHGERLPLSGEWQAPADHLRIGALMIGP